jgi:glucan phosphoethanolaminetransferase (alkaline phosphatase superfamily)
MQRVQRAHLTDSILNAGLTKRTAIFIYSCEVLFIALIAIYWIASNREIVWMTGGAIAGAILIFTVFAMLFRSIRQEWVIMKEIESLSLCREIMDS